MTDIADPPVDGQDELATLREVTETLAPMRRLAGTADEQRGADWILHRLRKAGCEAVIEQVDFYDGYALQLLPLAAISMAAGVVALRKRRSLRAAAAAGTAAFLISDDVSNGRRPWRRAIGKRKQTPNVIGHIGDPATADTVLVVMAHHDAALTGHVFDPALQRTVARKLPGVIQRINTSLPLFWPVIAGPLLVGAGALAGRRKLTAAGIAMAAGASAVGIDIARSPVTPGANDNLSGVAAVVALAERLQRRPPPPHVAVIFAAIGAEEVLQGGIYPFVEMHLRGRDPKRTFVLNYETIGSPTLVLLEGEGVTRMEDYTSPEWREQVAESAARVGVEVRRGQRSRSSTDSVVTSRAGFPTATLTSFEPDTKLLSNYHLMSDIPENLVYTTIQDAVRIGEDVVHRL